ncbi:MAG TPA: immunoglobulin domain-containing protein, partial [Verrucomicrobiae bacterium]|nr:immunoglobulin domain-containing protein [Verrucomicrobiae bacterium]
MKRRFRKSIFTRNKFAVCASLTALWLCQAVRSQTIPNASFEANSFSAAPGYISDNSDITGWTADVPSGAGLNPAGGDSSIADNGTVPNGTNVAFISGGTTLSTTMTGLTAGKVYKITLRVNATTAQTPILRITVDGTDIVALAIYPVGATAPYEYVAAEFTAAASTAVLGLVNDASSEQTLLVDNLTIAESSGKWAVAAWSDDATSGIDTQFVYTHAYSFGSSASAVVNGVPFTGVTGVNPQVANKFSTAHLGNVFNNDPNNITGGSAGLAKDFIYSGANVVSGDYETLTIKGLTPGTEYVATIYSAGWEGPSVTTRWATLSMGEDRLTFNQDAFENDNGIRMSYRYTAETNGTAVINIAPINPVNVSVHLYGFSNREAVSRNIAPGITVQPQGTTVAQGLPITFSVGASGFPAPTFQWRFNGANIAGATTNGYTIAQAGEANAGAYDVIVANSLGSATSTVARVVVGLPMSNSSFEADSFQSWPGYSGDNPGNANTPPGPNVPIADWIQSAPESSGINPIASGESPFADNGTIPNGRQVAFLQSMADTNTLSRTVSGLTVGSQYYLHYYENGRAASPAPVLGATLGSNVVVSEHLVPSGKYQEVFSDVFTAASASVELTFIKSSPGGADTTALIDNVAIVPVAAGTAPFIARNPTATAGAVGETVSLSGQVLGSLPLSFQWFRNGIAIPGATNATLSLTNIQAAAVGDYTLQASNSAG